jgi:ribulose-phosphate 3-epimerase
MKQIIPAILTKDIVELKETLAKLEGLVDWVQIDIMDNKFVPNISIPVKNLIDINTDINLEAHLMIFNPEKVFADCEKAGIKRVIFHLEAVDDVDKVLARMDEYSFEKGIAINPETKVKKIEPYLDRVDLVLFLSVNPGFQGQGFIAGVLDKVKELKKFDSKIIIEDDGGVNADNIKQVADAGVDLIVAGSAVLKGGDVEENLNKLREKLEE